MQRDRGTPPARACCQALTPFLCATSTQSQHFDSDDASSAILLASMMLLNPSGAHDKESLSKAVRPPASCSATPALIFGAGLITW